MFNKFLLAGDKFMSGIILRQPGLWSIHQNLRKNKEH